MSIEQQFVCTLANHPELISSVTVSPDDFDNPRVGRIYDTVRGIIERGSTPDILMVADTLEFESESNWITDVSELFDQISVPSNLEAYESVIKRQKRERQYRGAADRFLADVKSGDPAAGSNVLHAVKQIESNAGTGIAHVSEYAQGIVQHISDVADGKVLPGIPSGLHTLDEAMGGFQNGDMTVLAARTSIGKTAFMCNLAVNAKCKAGVISGEQSGSQITQRIMARLGGISAQRLRTGHLRESEYPLLAEAVKKLSDTPVYVVDKPRPSIEDIETLGRTLKWRDSIEILFIDYLQLIKNHAYAEKRLQIADISSRIKALAGELDIPIVVLAQLNRNADGKIPLISDLKESGSIEEDADEVILLYPDMDDGGKPLDNGQLTVDLQKHRHGAKIFFNVLWDSEYMRVRNLANEY
jgi:replicative DNA helicase